MELAMAAVAPALGGAGLGAAVGGGSALMGILQGVATVMSVMGSLNAASAEAQQATDMAIQTDLQAGQEEVQAAQRQTQMKRELFRVLGDNDVSFAAAGIDITSGIAQGARQAATTRATDELTIDRRDQEFRSAILKAKAAGYRRQAASAKQAGLFNAIGGIANFGISLAERG